MTPEEMERAGRDIAELLEFLVAQMRERGHDKAIAYFQIDTFQIDTADTSFTVVLRTRGDEAFARYGTHMDFAHCSGQTPTEAFEKASAAVRGMAESAGRQYAPYFDTSQHPPSPLTRCAAEGGDGLIADSNGEAVAADSSDGGLPCA